jgi:hypothetical protein
MTGRAQLPEEPSPGGELDRYETRVRIAKATVHRALRAVRSGRLKLTPSQVRELDKIIRGAVAPITAEAQTDNGWRGWELSDLQLLLRTIRTTLTVSGWARFVDELEAQRLRAERWKRTILGDGAPRTADPAFVQLLREMTARPGSSKGSSRTGPSFAEIRGSLSVLVEDHRRRHPSVEDIEKMTGDIVEALARLHPLAIMGVEQAVADLLDDRKLWEKGKVFDHLGLRPFLGHFPWNHSDRPNKSLSEPAEGLAQYRTHEFDGVIRRPRRDEPIQFWVGGLKFPTYERACSWAQRADDRVIRSRWEPEEDGPDDQATEEPLRWRVGPFAFAGREAQHFAHPLSRYIRQPLVPWVLGKGDIEDQGWERPREVRRGEHQEPNKRRSRSLSRNAESPSEPRTPRPWAVSALAAELEDGAQQPPLPASHAAGTQTSSPARRAPGDDTADGAAQIPTTGRGPIYPSARPSSWNNWNGSGPPTCRSTPRI